MERIVAPTQTHPIFARGKRCRCFAVRFKGKIHQLFTPQIVRLRNDPSLNILRHQDLGI